LSTADRLYHYSAIRYVPRPLAEEFVNIGVIAVSDDGEQLSVEFTSDWSRARALGGTEDDILMLRRLERAWRDEQQDAPLSRVHASGAGRAWLEGVYDQSANIVQLSPPRRALAADVDEVMDDLYESLIASARRSSATPKKSTGTRKRASGARKKTLVSRTPSAKVQKGAGRKVGSRGRSGVRRKR
jgi:hypothetical protein